MAMEALAEHKGGATAQTVKGKCLTTLFKLHFADFCNRREKTINKNKALKR
jgi:hypothetical protein